MSRAWGFESSDSDYDVRFIYVHTPEWYLSIDLFNQRDVIELPIRNDLDVNGWDLRKALTLFRKWNTPLLEWLGSPIVYQEVSGLPDGMRELVPTYYSPVACRFHYLHMAQTHYRDLQKVVVSHKNYFYVLRPLLGVRWVERGLGVVPTEFKSLVEHVLEEVEVKAAVDKLLEDKRLGVELDKGPRIEPISRFIDTELNRHANIISGEQPSIPPVEKLNELFRRTLDEVWTE